MLESELCGEQTKYESPGGKAGLRPACPLRKVPALSPPNRVSDGKGPETVAQWFKTSYSSTTAVQTAFANDPSGYGDLVLVGPRDH